MASTSPPTPAEEPRSAAKHGGERGAPVARRPSATGPLLQLSDRVKPRSRRWRTATACVRGVRHVDSRGRATGHLHHLRTFTTPLTAASNASLRSAMAATCMAAAERRLGEECAGCHAGGAASVPALRDGAPGVRQGALVAQQALRHAAVAGDGGLGWSS